MSACRSCGAQITWAQTEAGRRMPLDAEPDVGGNVVRIGNVEGTSVPLVRVESSQGTIGDTAPRYVSHFATCPNADSHRGPR